MNNESDMKRGVSSVKRHYNPSILGECTCKPDMVSMMCPIHGEQLAQEELDYEDLRSKLTEMESVLKWASENVWSPTRSASGLWRIGDITAPTLYEALWSAWKSAHPPTRM